MLLELKNIIKKFPLKSGSWGQERGYVRAVDDIDLSIDHGENLGLVGESGCGKTTAAKIILKLIPTDSGSMFLNKEDVSRISGNCLENYRRQIQMVFQDPYSSLDPRFTVKNIIREAMTLQKGVYHCQKDRINRICELLLAVGLKGDLLNRFPHEFSGGERQRVAIARALVVNPKLLILDEAVSSLDVIIQQQIIELLLELQKKYQLTYLLISHNLKVVRKICQRIAVMYRGKIVEMADSDEIFKNPIHPFTIELLAASVDYRSVQRDNDFAMMPNGCLRDLGNRHFVMEYE